MLKAPMLLNRRFMSVWISHLLYPTFEGCLIDLHGKDICSFGASQGYREEQHS